MDAQEDTMCVLEVLEENTDKIQSAYQTGDRQTASVQMGKYEEDLLENGEKPNIEQGADDGKTQRIGMDVLLRKI